MFVLTLGGQTVMTLTWPAHYKYWVAQDHHKQNVQEKVCYPAHVPGRKSPADALLPVL